MTKTQKLKCIFGFHDWLTVRFSVTGPGAATWGSIIKCQRCQHWEHPSEPMVPEFWKEVVALHLKTGRTDFKWEEFGYYND